jgi:predicted RNase H-like HicB family nuclease
VFEIRLRVLEAGEGSYLGIVERFPDIRVHATTAAEVEADATRALADHLERWMDREATRMQMEDFPTVRITRLYQGPRLG